MMNSANEIMQAISPRGISQEETHMTSHQLIPKSKNSRFVQGLGLTLDTDSEADASKLFIREKLMNSNTSRNIRNKTIDVPSYGNDYRTPKKGIHARSNLG